jgi:hypothetical protein
MQIEHLFGQFVHSEQLVDREICEFTRLLIAVDTATQNLKAVPDTGDGIPDLMSELSQQSGSRGMTIPLNEFSLEHRESVLAVFELLVGVTELLDPLG